jgi:hypothetical protein
MKQLIAGGFLFIGGCILYAVGTLGFADSAVATSDMQAPMYIGIVVMLAGITMGILGLQNKD